MIKKKNYFNGSSFQVIGSILLFSFPFLYNDFNIEHFDNFFNKISAIAALSALVVSLLNEMSTDSKFQKQNERFWLESKLNYVSKLFEGVTFDFRRLDGVYAHSRGFHAFKVAMGDFGAISSTLIRDPSSFSFWEAQLVLNGICDFLEEFNNAETELDEQYYPLALYSMERIEPMLHIYQEFYNYYLKIPLVQRRAGTKLEVHVNGLKSKIDEIQPKYSKLKNYISGQSVSKSSPASNLTA